MSTHEVAQKLVQFCREGKNIDAINELYADNIISLEHPGTPMERAESKDAVLEKNNNWYQSVQEVHSVEISDPVITGEFFAVAMDMDVTYKKSGRMQMHEIAVYQVKGGKIVFEQFHYSMGN
jgi:SnoaL-like domain